MNGTATRLANRQIRRAFGEEALDTINQQGETLTNIVLPRLMTLGKTAGEVDTRLKALETSNEVAVLLRENTDRAIGRIAAFQQMSRWQRLKWVLGW